MQYLKRSLPVVLGTWMCLLINIVSVGCVQAAEAHFDRGYFKQRNLVTNHRDKYKSRMEWDRSTLEDDKVVNAWGLSLILLC